MPGEKTDAVNDPAIPRTSRITVPASLPAVRLDSYLRSQFPAVSRGTIQRLISEEHVRVNGKIAKPTQAPRAGDHVEVHWPQPRPAETKPENIALETIFEDKDLAVINKPAGLVVHPSAGHADHTLVNALLHHCKGKLSGIGGVARPGIVHRLDKDTSGCIVVAKNDEAHLGLAAQFSAREMSKVYLAIVCGEMPKPSGDIRAPIARHPGHRKRMTATAETGRDAWTGYKVRERLNGATLVEALLHTGRTHQIRVHFQHLGFPVFGDETYGQRQTSRLIAASSFKPERLLLHSWKLAFRHPITGKRIAVEAPVPDDFQKALKALSP